MQVVWIKHLSDQESKDRFKSLLANHIHSDPVFKRLFDILSEKKDDASNNLASLDKMINSPNWAYGQAYHLGVINTLKELEDLFKLEKKATRPNVKRNR